MSPASFNADLDAGVEVRPAVIVVDKSGSMDEVLPQVSTRVNGLIERLHRVPSLRDTVALAVVEFDTEPRVRRPLSRRPKDGTEFQFEHRRRRTDFGAALRACQRILSEDLPRIAPHCYRPVIFFISDGGHNLDDFGPQRSAILGLPLAPKIVVFEVVTDDHDEQTLRSLATAPGLYMPVGASEEAINDMTNSIYGTLGSVGAGTSGGVAESYLDGEIDDRGNQRVYRSDSGKEV